MLLPISLANIAQTVANQIEAELPSRASRAANALLNAKNEVLRGEGGGRWYGGHHASAPGQPPANWSGHFRDSWVPLSNDAHLPGIMTNCGYAGYLEHGTSKMAPRPFIDKITVTAEPEVVAVYSEPWHISI